VLTLLTARPSVVVVLLLYSYENELHQQNKLNDCSTTISTQRKSLMCK